MESISGGKGSNFDFVSDSPFLRRNKIKDREQLICEGELHYLRRMPFSGCEIYDPPLTKHVSGLCMPQLNPFHVCSNLLDFSTPRV